MIEPMTLAAWAGGALLAVGAVGALVRLVRGPSLLDRAIASDVLLVVLSAALILEMAVHHHTRTIMVVLLAAAVGFVGSVTVARFVEDRRPDHRREEHSLLSSGPEDAAAPGDDERTHP